MIASRADFALRVAGFDVSGGRKDERVAHAAFSAVLGPARRGDHLRRRADHLRPALVEDEQPIGGLQRRRGGAR